jgi:hypothetical protein
MGAQEKEAAEAAKTDEPKWHWREAENGSESFYFYGPLALLKAKGRDDTEAEKGYAIVQFDGEPAGTGGEVVDTADNFQLAREAAERRFRDQLAERSPGKRQPPKREQPKPAAQASVREEAPKPTPKGGQRRSPKKGVAKAAGAQRVA